MIREQCYDYEDLDRYRTGGLEEEATRRIREHVRACEACASRLRDVSTNEEIFGRVAAEFGNASEEAGADTDSVSASRADAPAPLPRSIGRYRIVRVLGEGGMGIVYLAEQENPKRLVALKVIRPEVSDRAVRERFTHEARILARLHHPGIAQVHEAGFTGIEGPAGERREQPFIAMEYVRGERLDRYLSSRDSSIEDRLRLMARICDAAHHAHLNGVVHRDLKPGNVVVVPPEHTATPDPGRIDRSGRPMILDFGVARLTEADLETTMRTRTGQIIGTIPFMSPEQIDGDPDSIDARSDVYSLGVIGFFLLTGTLPHDLRGKSLVEAARIIRDEEPRRLSRCGPGLPADLEAVFSKALEKETSRRYQSASELAADIRRYLADEPVLARAPSATYQLSKFTKRNRAIVASATVLVVALAVFGIVMSVMFTRAREAERVASREAATAQRTTDFLAGLFSASNPTLKPAEELSARDILDEGAERVREELDDEPEVAARLLHHLGRVYDELGEYDQGRELLEASLDRRIALHGENHFDVAETLNDLGLIEMHSGRIDEGAAALERALAIERAVLDEDHALTAMTLANIGSVRYYRGEFAAAESLFRETLEIRRRILEPPHPDLTQSMNNLAAALLAQDRYEEAEPYVRETIAMLSELHGELHPHVTSTKLFLALLLRNAGRDDEAEATCREVLAMRLELYDADHPQVANAWHNLGLVLHQRQKWDEGEAAFREAVRIHELALEESHPNVGNTLLALGRLLLDTDRTAEAGPVLRGAVRARRAAFPEGHDSIREAENALERVAQPVR